jgi:5-methylcytosine-specific restriction endonuclease McrA
VTSPASPSTKVLRARQRRQQKQAALYAFLGGACAHCGESHPATLVIHHIDPATKTRSFRGKGWAESDITPEFVQELATCLLLCANCHAKVHWEAV